MTTTSIFWKLCYLSSICRLCGCAKMEKFHVWSTVSLHVTSNKHGQKLTLIKAITFLQKGLETGLTGFAHFEVPVANNWFHFPKPSNVKNIGRQFLHLSDLKCTSNGPQMSLYWSFEARKPSQTYLKHPFYKLGVLLSRCRSSTFSHVLEGSDRSLCIGNLVTWWFSRFL